jgi:hypothetical protein
MNAATDTSHLVSASLRIGLESRRAICRSKNIKYMPGCVCKEKEGTRTWRGDVGVLGVVVLLPPFGNELVKRIRGPADQK